MKTAKGGVGEEEKGQNAEGKGEETRYTGGVTSSSPKKAGLEEEICQDGPLTHSRKEESNDGGEKWLLTRIPTE